jgi:biotin transport system substrate-specific component
MFFVSAKELSVDKASSRSAGVFVFIILTSLSGFVRIPLGFTPVPITLQTFFVLLSGALLGSRLGAASQMGYVLLGALGLPVFSQAGSGFAYLAGPTAGYMFGFVAASFVLGRLLPAAQNFAGACAVFIAADMLILCMGSMWLAMVSGCGLAKAFVLGCVPFIIGDVIKASCAAAVYLRLRGRAARYF